MVLGGERASVHNPSIRFATEASWNDLPPAEALRLCGGQETIARLQDARVILKDGECFRCPYRRTCW